MNDITQLICPDCGKFLKDNSGLANHIRFKHTDRPAAQLEPRKDGQVLIDLSVFPGGKNYVPPKETPTWVWVLLFGLLIIFIVLLYSGVLTGQAIGQQSG